MQLGALRLPVQPVRIADSCSCWCCGRGIQHHLVSMNRTVLLHGPPGTGAPSCLNGKAEGQAHLHADCRQDVHLQGHGTEACHQIRQQASRAAQLLSGSLSIWASKADVLCRWHSACLIEVNAHSLFSKWFSESGKLVAALFERIQTELADSHRLVFVLIDEVESLTAARQAAMDSGEPADSIRHACCCSSSQCRAQQNRQHSLLCAGR